MSSSFSYLDNQNKKFRTTINCPGFQTSAASWMATVHPVPSFCKIEKITLSASAAPSTAAINLTVLNDGAAWRSAANDSAKAPFIVGTASVNMANRIASFTFTDGMYYEDSFRTNCLYLNFANNSFAEGDTFTVTVEGTQMAPYKLEHIDTTPFVGDNTWKILKVDSNNVCTDLTQELSRRGNPYGLGSTLENSESFVAFDTAADYLYIGSARPWTNAMFYVPSYSANKTPVTFAQYTGTSWSTVTSVQDNTSAGMNTSSSLSYSGVMKVTSWTSAVMTTLSFDPTTVLQVEYDDFTKNIPRPGGWFANPQRYWLRMKFSSITPSDIKLVGIVPVK